MNKLYFTRVVERERQRARQRETETERQRQRETGRQTERDREKRTRKRGGERERERERDRQRQRQRQTDRQAETDADVADVLPDEYLYDVLTHRFRLARDTLVTLVRHQLLSHALSSVTQDNVARTQTGCRVLKLTPYDTPVVTYPHSWKEIPTQCNSTLNLTLIVMLAPILTLINTLALIHLLLR